MKYLASGEKAKGGTAKGSKQSEFYGTGLKGRQVKAAIAREAAQKAEEKYAEIVAERAAGKQTHSPEGQRQTGRDEMKLDPLRPRVEDWEAEIALITARVLSEAPKRTARRSGPAQAAGE